MAAGESTFSSQAEICDDFLFHKHSVHALMEEVKDIAEKKGGAETPPFLIGSKEDLSAFVLLFVV